MCSFVSLICNQNYKCYISIFFANDRQNLQIRLIPPHETSLNSELPNKQNGRKVVLSCRFFRSFYHHLQILYSNIGLLNQIASLAYEESESEESSEEEYDKEDPLWALYQHVRNYKSPKDDLLLCDPFLQLPSRREFADYYLTIGEPISLNEIRKKLKASEYER